MSRRRPGAGAVSFAQEVGGDGNGGGPRDGTTKSMPENEHGVVVVR